MADRITPGLVSLAAKVSTDRATWSWQWRLWLWTIMGQGWFYAHDGEWYWTLGNG